MSKSIMYAGVDVGKNEFWVALGTAKPRKFAHSAAGVRALGAHLSKVAGHRRVHLCMEATGIYSQALALRLLTLPNVEVSIVNPAQIKAFARAQLRRTKTDRVDAAVILAFAKSQRPAPWTPESPAAYTLARLVAQRQALDEDVTRWKNRQHAASYDLRAVAEVDRSQAEVVQTLIGERERVEKAIAELLAAEPELAADRAVLQTIIGIGPISSIQLLAYAKGCLTVRTGKEVTAHAGLAPAEHQSGSSVHGKSHLAKQGNVHLRTCLYMPTVTAITHNPVIREFYHRLLAQNKPPKVALVACMRKLLMIARAILISRQPFNPAYQRLT